MLEKKLNALTTGLSTENYDTCKHSIEEFMKLKEPTRNSNFQLVDKVVVNENKEVDVYLKFTMLSYICCFIK